MSSDPKTEIPRQSRWWIRWFPVLWWGFLFLLWGLLQWRGQHSMDSDVVMVGTIALLNLAWLIPLLWLLFFWGPIKRRSFSQKWLIRVAAAAAVVGIFSSLDVDYDGDSRWRAVRLRWAADPDENLSAIQPTASIDQWQTTPNDYPRFLGNGYWAEVNEVELATDWQQTPPKLVWKRDIGAGWSAFAVVGDYAVTQEQRGDQELVTCYRVSDGEPVWVHSDHARHDPADVAGGLGGVGPRATPTIYEARVYTMGATGIVNCLDAQTGEAIWSHQLAEDYSVEPLYWANAGSPVIVPDSNLVVVNGGKAKAVDGHSLLAFDRDSGELVWQAGPQTTSYASPVFANLAGVPQIVQVNEATVAGYRASDGTSLWQVDQPGKSDGNASCSQPIPLAGDRVLVSKGYGIGSRLLQLQGNQEGEVTAKLVWQKRVLKTKLANLVVRDGYAYGLDATLLSCVDIETGKVQWKKRRQPAVGHGQLLLVGSTIIAISETGEGILFECNPQKYVELASQQLITDAGITWNNPAISGRYLLVRNNLEAACYLLPAK